MQTLGLPGEAARTRPKGNSKRAGAGAGSTGGSVGVLGGGAGGPDRYVSAFDLSSKAFRPGKPLHDRVLACLGGGRLDGEENIDMVVCWWSDCDGREEERGERGGGGDAPREKVPEQGKGGKGVLRVGDQGRAAGGGGDIMNSSGRERMSGKESGQHKQKKQYCREIAFPASFSVEIVDLVPDIRFFREACCPDLNFVAQGLASTRVTRSSPATKTSQHQQQQEQGGTRDDSSSEAAISASGGAVKNATMAAVTAGEESQETTWEPPPPESAKCLLLLDMFEWLGAVSCGLGAQLRREPSPPEPHLSEFETPRHLRYRRHRTVCRARLRGLLPPLAVARFINAAGAVAAAAAAGTAIEAMSHSTSQSAEAPVGQAIEKDTVEGETTLDSYFFKKCFGQQQQTGDGCSWGSVTAWPFRDAPLAYAGAGAAPCGGGADRAKAHGGRGGSEDNRMGGRSFAKEWPVGGHGVYTVVACPHETASAYISAGCPGPGW